MKEIKDYLHFYIGCEVTIEGHKNAILGAVGVGHGKQVIIRWPLEDEWSYADIGEIRPILRRLSDMTEEEEAEMVKTQDDVKLDGYPQITLMVDSGHTFRWLLSKGFDIFNLIDSGLAIDAKDY